MDWKRWIPNAVTLLLAALLVLTQQVWAGPITSRLTAATTGSSKTTINYQGYLTDSNGDPVDNSALQMAFRLYDVEGGGSALWSETQSNVAVNDGLFSVLLGKNESIPVEILANHSDLWLGIAVGSDVEMAPRDKIASSPYAMLANIPDGSITQAKLAGDAVSSAKIQDGQVSTNDVGFNYAGSSSKGGPASNVSCSNCISSGEIQDGQVTSADIANNTVSEADIADNFKARDADQLDGKNSTDFASSGHNHDGRYYTESESDSRYARSNHNHDGRYYTESESNSRFVRAPASNTKIAHGRTTASRQSSRPEWGVVEVSLSSYGFSETPTVLCGTAGVNGSEWTCHVEYENKNGFTIWVKNILGNTSWSSVAVRWIAIGQ